MHENKTKRRSKVSLRITKGREKLFDVLVALSGKSTNEFVNDRIFSSNADKLAEQIRLAQVLAEAQQIKVELQRQKLLSEDADRELKLIRIALMSRMGRRS